jgi:FtsH-binding integral membrane protein
MRLMDRLVLRSGFERATYRFALKTLLRNDRHSLLLGAFAGLGLVIASQTLVAAFGQTTADADSLPGMALLSAPLVLAYFLICGLRFVFDLPAELRANWVHRVILDREQPGTAAVARKIILTFVLPWVVAVCLPLYLYLWGGMGGGALFTVLIAGCCLMPEILLRRFRKVPFACAYPAWKQNATVIVLLYVLGLWAFAFLLPGLERAFLARSPWYLWGLGLLLLSAVYVLRHRRQDEERGQALVFDEVSDSPFEFLNLSGR